jgi:uncharacterized protein (DUF58 family)
VSATPLDLPRTPPEVAPWWTSWAGVPTGVAVVVVSVPLLLSLAVLFEPLATVPVVALDLVIGLVALGDLALARRASMEVARSFHAVQSVGRAFDVTVVVRNTSSRAWTVRVDDSAPGTVEGLPTEPVALEAGQARALTYRVRLDHRGQYGFGPVTVRAATPLGWFERQWRFTVPGVVRVYPDFARLRELVRGRVGEDRAPVRARRRTGGENEFQRLRPYVAGDPYRHIDWKATARHRSHVTREFGQESNQNLVFLLDCGRTMSGRSGDLSHLDHALNAAVLLGQAALRNGDRVGLLAFDRRVRVWLPPKGGARTADRLIRATYDLEPSLEEPDWAAAFRHLQGQVRRRSLVVLLTAIQDDVNADLVVQLVKALRSRHLPLAVVLRDADTDELLGASARSDDDRFDRGAAAEVLHRRALALRGMEKRGALVVDAAPHTLTADLLNRYLEIKARRLL